MLIYYKNREVDKQINQCKKNSICESDIKYKYRMLILLPN